jgi:hypothetical protein
MQKSNTADPCIPKKLGFELHIWLSDDHIRAG